MPRSKPKRMTKAELEERRLKAGPMFQSGADQVEVARVSGVSAPTACRWHRLWSEGGSKKLKARPQGRPLGYSQQQLEDLGQKLSQLARRRDRFVLTRSELLPIIQETLGYRPTRPNDLLRRIGWSSYHGMVTRIA